MIKIKSNLIQMLNKTSMSLNKTIEITTITIIIRPISLENNKFYPQVFLDECLYKI